MLFSFFEHLHAFCCFSFILISDHPITQSINQLVSQSVGQQSINQSISQSTNQSVSQSFNQSIDRSIKSIDESKQPVYECISLLVRTCLVTFQNLIVVSCRPIAMAYVYHHRSVLVVYKQTEQRLHILKSRTKPKVSYFRTSCPQQCPI